MNTTLFESINHHLMHDDIPSHYLNTIYELPEFGVYPFSLLQKLRSTEQSPIHHPEGNVWNHTLFVVDEAAKVKNQSRSPNIFMWAALLHDIGKPSTTKKRKGKITSYDHDKLGAKLSCDFLSVFTDDSLFIEDVSSLIRYHMQILFVLHDLPFADIKGMHRDTDIHEVALLGLCDRLGRTGSSQRKEEENIQLFIRKCTNQTKRR